jgi:hypothetical protein
VGELKLNFSVHFGDEAQQIREMVRKEATQNNMTFSQLPQKVQMKTLNLVHELVHGALIANKFATGDLKAMRHIVTDWLRKDYCEEWRKEIVKGNRHLPNDMSETLDRIELLMSDRERFGQVLDFQVTRERLTSIRREIIDH